MVLRSLLETQTRRRVMQSLEETTLLAIDPGGEHVGTALFRQTGTHPWECIHTEEFTPRDFEELLVWIDIERHAPDIVVYELFQLYPEMATTLIGSEMETSQLIGVIKHYATRWPVDLVAQPAHFQKTAQGLLRTAGIRSTAKKHRTGPHTFSAELHGWAAIQRGYPAPTQEEK